MQILGRSELGRRRFMVAAGHGLAAAAALGRQEQPEGAGGTHPSKPENSAKGDKTQKPKEGKNPAVGKPASKTDAAQGGKTTVPGVEDRKVGIAIVGIGKLTVGEIMPAFAQCIKCEPVALVSGDRDKARAVAAAYGVDEGAVYDYDGYDAIRDNPAIDAVYIVLPNSMHREHTERAAAAGKHVLCEKPMATTSADCRAMIAACERAKRRLMIAYRCHYEPYNLKMMEWGKERKYGKPSLIVSDTVMDVGGKGQWRLDRALNGDGSLFDIGIYSLNAARYLTGEEPSEVSAMMYSDPKDARFKEIEQSIAFQLRFPSGAIANCTSSYGTGTVNRYRVIGTEGFYGLEPATKYRGLECWHGTLEKTERLHLEEVNQFAAEMDHFAECVLGDKEPRTGGAEGLKDVALIEKIYDAAKGGRAVKG